MDQVAAAEVLPWTVVAERGDARGDQTGEVTGEIWQREPGGEFHLRQAAAQKDVGFYQKRKQRSACRRDRQVQQHRVLVAVVGLEKEGAPVLREWRHAPRRRAGEGLDLGDMCAEPGEQKAAVLGLRLAQFQDPQTLQQARIVRIIEWLDHLEYYRDTRAFHQREPRRHIL